MVDILPNWMDSEYMCNTRVVFSLCSGCYNLGKKANCSFVVLQYPKYTQLFRVLVYSLNSWPTFNVKFDPSLLVINGLAVWVELYSKERKESKNIKERETFAFQPSYSSSWQKKKKVEKKPRIGEALFRSCAIKNTLHEAPRYSRDLFDF